MPCGKRHKNYAPLGHVLAEKGTFPRRHHVGHVTMIKSNFMTATLVPTTTSKRKGPDPWPAWPAAWLQLHLELHLLLVVAGHCVLGQLVLVAKLLTNDGL